MFALYGMKVRSKDTDLELKKARYANAMDRDFMQYLEILKISHLKMMEIVILLLVSDKFRDLISCE